jgi:hypothetical protein
VGYRGVAKETPCLIDSTLERAVEIALQGQGIHYFQRSCQFGSQ